MDIKNLVSVIIRYHSGGNFEYLKDALFSISLQSHDNIELVLMLHNCDQKTISTITHFIKDLSYSPSLIKNLQISNFSSKKDIRAKLLNEGLNRSKGEYICFLDYDDIFYSNAFEFHVESLKNSDAVVSVGKCRLSQLDVSTPNSVFTITKKNFNEKPFSLEDELIDNHLPIHSFMIRRTKVNAADLYFNTDMTVLEDYDFILRLISKYEFDFSKANIPVCEYRVRNDNSNTNQFDNTSNLAKMKEWEDGRKKIKTLKSTLVLNHTIEVILRMSKKHA